MRGAWITISLKRSDPAFLARLAMPIACPVPAGTPHREVRDLLARHSTGRYRVVESSSSVIDLARVKRATAVPNGGAPGAAAAISVTRLGDANALDAAVRSGSADISLDDLPVSAKPALAVPSSALAILRVDPARWPLSDERVRRALSLALDRRVLALSDGGDVLPARSLLLDPQAPSALPPIPSPRAACFARPAPRARSSSRCGRSRGRRSVWRERSQASSPASASRSRCA